MTKKKKIINPSTGRWVNRDGEIGKRLVKTASVISSRKKYNELTRLWNWWADRSAKERQEVAKSYWNTKLNDQIKNDFPFYLKSYENVLKKAYSIASKNI